MVGAGLAAAAIAGGQGVASASTDDSSNSGDTSSSADGPKSAGDSKDTNTDAPSAPADTDTDTDATRDANARTSTKTGSVGSAKDADADATEDDVDDSPIEDADEVAADPDEEDAPLEDSTGEASDVPSPVATAPAVQLTDQTGSTDVAASATPGSDKSVAIGIDEPTLSTAFVVAPEPTTGSAPVAMAAMAAAAPEPGTAEWYFIGVLDRAVRRLMGWTGTLPNFVDITNYQTDHTLDAANDQLDALIWAALPGSPARWLPDLNGIVGMFFGSAIPGSTFTDALNVIGDFLNRVVPPFNIDPGAGTFGVITPYKIMGAAVVAVATVLTDMLNGIYDLEQWEIDIIRTTTGAVVTRADLTDFASLFAKVGAAQAGAIATFGLIDGGAFYEPERAWAITLPTWTAAQVNPFTIVTYIALVAIYKRWQEIAVRTEFTISTTYATRPIIGGEWNYTESVLGLPGTYSQYAAGTFTAVDPDGNAVEFPGLLATYTSAGGALVTINTSDGGFTYTNTLPGTAFFHRAFSENEDDRYDTVNIPVTSVDGAAYTLTFKIRILPGDGANHAPTATHTVDSTDALGVVKGKVTGSDSDGDTMTYSLVGASVNGLSGNSAYTQNGAGNGGIVTINPTTGDFTYVSTSTAGTSLQSFQVRVSDGHGGSVIRTVTVTNSNAVITPANLNTSTPYVVTGSVPGSTNYPGVFTYYTPGTPPTKGSVTSFDPYTGAFTYTSSVGRTTANDDVVTVIAADANGRTVTLRMAVRPTVVNNVPVVVSTTTDKGSSDPNKWRLDTLTGDNRRQTTTGQITATDADGDTPLTYSLVDPVTHAPVTTTTDGGAVTFGAGGSFTYTITKDKSYFHAAAQIGASAADTEDTFTVAVTDGFTGSVTYTTVTISTFAVNSNPTLSVPGLACGLAICSVTITTTDPDGDDLSGDLPTANPGNGNAWQTLAPRGSITVNLGNGHTMSWTGNTNGLGTQQTGINRYTVYDGYYRVTNGVVDSGYFTRAWVEWNGTSRSFGN